MKPILTLLSLLFVGQLHSETLNQLRLRVDNKLTNMVPTLVARQNTYASNHGGKFWQGLITFSALPAHTTSTVADSIADRLTVRPTDQDTSWSDVFPEWDSELFAAAAKIDVYDGSEGKGWVLTVYVKHNGITYYRVKAWGNETWRDRA